MNGARMRSTLVVMLAPLAAACTPDVGASNAPAPTAMEFDLTAVPPRAPQPTGLIINPGTGKIDFALAGTPLPEDCSTQQVLTQAQCQFDQWLQTLNGFPTVTTASAPVSKPLDTATLTVGQNVVVVTNDGTAVADVVVGLNDASSALTVTPTKPWALGQVYWIGVRGYANGVLDAWGGEVVGSPTMALLKQDTSLTCDATDPDSIDPHCPGFEVVGQSATSPEALAAARAQLFQLEQIRMAYAAGFAALDMAGLPKSEIAVMWGFPIHTNSVPLLVPSAGAVPKVAAADQLFVGVQGLVDPATVSAFVVREQNGPVVVMDLAAAAAGDLNAGFPRVGAAYVSAAGAIAIKAAAPFPAGHPIGLFFSNGIHSPPPANQPLVASPVSVLLSLSAPLVDGGHSTVSGISDADAAALDAGRSMLAAVFDNPLLGPLTGVTRANLVYAYAFIPMVQP
jgi:hypothetical protein